MDFLNFFWHTASAFAVFITGLITIIKWASYFGAKGSRAVILYIWHTVFCFAYMAFILSNGGDALDYYEASFSDEVPFSFGTDAIIFLTHIFTYYFKLSFVGAFLIYNLFGAIGLLAFDASLRYASHDKVKYARTLAGVLIFLPSVSFWSAGIGKDAISFMAAGLAIWAAIDFSRRTWLMVFSILAMLFVRPHIAALMVVAVAGSIAFHGKISAAKKGFLILISILAISIIVPFALHYSGLEGASELDAYVDNRQSHNQDGGGGIDISQMSLPVQFFTYLFRPLPFEAHSIFSLASSFDNVLLLLVFVLGLLGFIKHKKSRSKDGKVNKIFLYSYSLSCWLVLATTTANLGISVRQKWMFVPMLAFLLISMMPKRRYVSKNASHISANPAEQENLKK